MVTKRDVPGDRERMNLAHELGHLVMGTDDDKLAFRFAGAFLVPAEVAFFELGKRRRTLSFRELYLLKQKYGLSMQGWVYRAKDLRIVSESAAANLFRQFRVQGYHRQEPGEQFPVERPKRLARLVLRALAEELISDARATELLGEPVSQYLQEELGQDVGFSADVRH
jgi:Zn-dependent peptidase ImmA (M78 family)